MHTLVSGSGGVVPDAITDGIARLTSADGQIWADDDGHNPATCSYCQSARQLKATRAAVRQLMRATRALADAVESSLVRHPKRQVQRNANADVNRALKTARIALDRAQAG